MNFRVFLIVCLSSLPITVAAQSPAFTLQGNTIHDYQPSLEQATKQLAQLLAIEPSEIPHLQIVLNKTATENQNYQQSAPHEPLLILSEDLLEKKQRANETMASVVAHEACHLWLIELAKQRGLEQVKQGYLPSYGHSQLNDWFDEMVAVACEQGALAEQRRQADFSFIPLATYLTQMHPVYERMQAQIAAAVAAQKAKKSGGQSVVKLTVEDENFADFYRQSAYFAEFLMGQPEQISIDKWLHLAQEKDPEIVAIKLGFKNLAEFEQTFYQFIPW